MQAVWYEKFGTARDVLVHGSIDDPVPGSGDVLVRLQASAVNPSDVKLRAGARPGATMAFPRIIPHSDGAGVIEAVGPGVDKSRVGERVWIWNGQWQRPFGTAAELISIPSHQAVLLPDNTDFAEAACFGIPAMTAWYALFGDSAELAGQTVLVTGGAGTVGRYACQLAGLAGARVITSVSSKAKADHSTADEWVNYRDGNVAEQIMDMTNGAGVDRIIDVDFGANQEASLAVIKDGGTISAYASAADMTPALAFYPLMFKNITLRMVIAYLIPPHHHLVGERMLWKWLREGKISHAVVDGGTLRSLPSAHELVEAGEKLGTVVVGI